MICPKTSKIKKRLYFLVASYFRFFANISLKKWSPRIIAITGSVGKTTMLNLLEVQLGKKAHYSHNANSAFGIAFDILGLTGITNTKLKWFYLLLAAPIRALYFKRQEKFYIVEIDGERPKETRFLSQWLKPEVTVWISLGRSHACQFDCQVENGEFENLDKAIAHEFAMLPQYTKKLVIINAEVPLIVKATTKVKQKHNIPANIISATTPSALEYSVAPNSSSFKFAKLNFSFTQPMPKDISIQLVMITELMNYLNLPLKTDLSKFVPPPGRSSYFLGKNGLNLIDSSYNAHLISVQSILEMTRELKAKPKWLVLGDIVDQGSIEAEEHTKLANDIIKTKPDQVILVGKRLQKHTKPLLKQANLPVFSTTDPKLALKFIQQHATNQETIVFKGSQYLEWIIEKLLLNPADAKYLPRREKAAVRRRQKRGLN